VGPVVRAERDLRYGQPVRLELTKASRRLIPLLLWLASSCGGRDESDPAREALFQTVAGGSVQHDHPCPDVRAAEVSASNGILPESVWDGLRTRIAEADLAAVQGCLAEVQAYNRCFLDLPCDAFANSHSPAWLVGADAAPCACGVVLRPFGGTLPKNLASCIGILPVSVAPSRPGVGCPE